jgi:ABC-2 type transport system ATP-binding protein
MLEVSHLTKTYKDAKQPSLKNVSFKVEDGEVYGIVGKNGAGKSTTIKCILGLHPFEKGSIILNGVDIKKEENKLKQMIGYVPDNHLVYENLTGREYINFMANIYGVNNVDRQQRIKNHAEKFDMTDALDLQIKGYSHGMRQKICIIGALIHEPKLWILDEPFLGLDPKSVKTVKECIKEYALDKNHMVIFTSHIIETVVEICDRVCVIENGEVKATLKTSSEYGLKRLNKLLG